MAEVDPGDIIAIDELFDYIDKGRDISSVLPLLQPTSHVNSYRTHYGETPLRAAVRTNHMKNCAQLLDFGADINLMSGQWVRGNGDKLICIPTWSVLHEAMMPKVSVELMNMLLDRGAEVNFQPPRFDGFTPLHSLLCIFSCLSMNSPDQFMKLDVLLKHPSIDIHIRSSAGSNCLHECAGEGNGEVAKRVMNILIQHHIYIDAQDYHGRSELYHLCKPGLLDVFDYLLTKGADPCLVDIFGNSCLHGFAESHFKKEIPEFIEIVERAKLGLNIQNYFGESILHKICHPKECAGMIEALIKAGADVNLRNAWGQTPMYVCCYNSTPLRFSNTSWFIELLHKYGADVNNQDVNTCTPLMHAVIQNNHDIIDVLLLCGANVNAVDKNGRSALHHCILSGKDHGRLTMTPFKVAELLLANYADLYASDKFGKTVIDYATFMDDKQKTKFLASLPSEHNISCDLKKQDIWNQYKDIKLKAKSHFSVQVFVNGRLSEEVSANMWTNTKRLVQDILYTPGVGIVEGVKEFCSIRKQIEYLVTVLAKRMSQEDKLLTYTPTISGGVSEGSKIGFPDEFDYLVYVDGLLDYLQPDDKATEPAFVHLRARNAESCSGIYQNISRCHGML